MGTKKTQEERITKLEENLERTKQCLFLVKFTLSERIRELEAKVEDLHATDSARRLNMATEDPEWY
jgi:predicted RecB family endonuclease